MDLTGADRQRERGVVSVVVVNYRTAPVTIECLQGLSVLDWPADRLQIICVDNASGDGSADAIRAACPDVEVVESTENTGFAGGCNFGADHARGEYIALINSDARPDAQWLRAAVDQLEYDRGIACVASRVLDWDGETIDYVGGALTFHGMGYKREVGAPAEGVGLEPKDVLFATGAAMVIRADVFDDAGRFDEQFFMFYEDVDLGWRLNLLGYRVRYVPESVVFHKHHVSISSFASYRERYLLERNALLSIVKNYESSTLNTMLAPSLLLSVARSMAYGEGDLAALDLQRSPGGDESRTLEVDKLQLAGPLAIAYVAEHFGELMAQREALQSRRARPDKAIARLFEDAMFPLDPQEQYLSVFRNVVAAFPIAETLGSRRNILIITGDVLSERMAGPAIRAYHIAMALAPDHNVRLVSTSSCSIENSTFECFHVPRERLAPSVEWSDIIIFQGFILHEAPWIAETQKIIVADIYDPMHLEQLEQFADADMSTRRSIIGSTTDVLNGQLRRADFFLCASESQRRFWLGQLAGVGRINPLTYDRDTSLRSLIDICPFGLSAERPVRTKKAIKGVTPGIGEDDKVIIWAGGVYNWFDPLTLIQAVADLAERRPNVRLFFLGMKHPNPHVPEMRMAFQARELADQLGLIDKHVFFNEEWVDYNERQNYLLDSDVGVSTHFDHVETMFSFRTRMLDYIWADLPIVATEGDTFGELIAAEGLGVTVHERDVAALSAALERALFDEEFAASCREQISAVRQRFVWERALSPLIDFCRDARPAADRPVAMAAPYVDRWPTVIEGSVWQRNLYYAKERLKEGGVRSVAHHGAAKAVRLSKGALTRAGRRAN